VETGSRAAAVGGYTALAAMANTDPVADNTAVIEEVRSLAARAGLCDVLPVGAITKDLAGEEMAELGEMAHAGVRVFSDDGRCVSTSWVLRNALRYAGAFDVVIAEHCEDASLAEGAQMHEGLHSHTLGLAGAPPEAEEIIVFRDLSLARETGGRLHLCHLSAAGSVELVRRAKAAGVGVTAEVTPHHLVFTDEDLVNYDTNYKVNPPLRTPEDRDALRAAVADGTIDAIATNTNLTRHGLATLPRPYRLYGHKIRPGEDAVAWDHGYQRLRATHPALTSYPPFAAVLAEIRDVADHLRTAPDSAVWDATDRQWAEPRTGKDRPSRPPPPRPGLRPVAAQLAPPSDLSTPRYDPGRRSR